MLTIRQRERFRRIAAALGVRFIEMRKTRKNGIFVEIALGKRANYLGYYRLK